MLRISERPLVSQERFCSMELMHWIYKSILYLFASYSDSTEKLFIEDDCLWKVAQCSLAEIDWRFRLAYCLHLQSLMVKLRSIYTRLHGAKFQKTPSYLPPWEPESLQTIYCLEFSWNMKELTITRTASMRMWAFRSLFRSSKVKLALISSSHSGILRTETRGWLLDGRIFTCPLNSVGKVNGS